MKKWIYAIGVGLLPVVYVGLMYLTGEPIDWKVLALMAVIVLPIFVFAKRIGLLEKEVNAMSDEEKLKAIGKAAAKVARKAAGQE